MLIRWAKTACWFVYGAIRGAVQAVRHPARCRRVLDAAIECDDCSYPETRSLCIHHGEMLTLGLEPEDYGEMVGEDK